MINAKHTTIEWGLLHFSDTLPQEGGRWLIPAELNQFLRPRLLAKETGQAWNAKQEKENKI